jgi:Protein of unknown function (DUF3617)
MMRRAPVLAVFAAGAALAASPMQPGQWDSTVSVVRSGQVPLVSTDSDCVSQKDIDDGSKSLPKPGDNCQLANVATVEGRTTYDFACRDGDIVRTGRAEFVIEATRYEGKLELVSRKGSGPEATTSMTWTARRVGACKQ